MKAKSNKQSKGSKHHPAVKDIPPKGNPLGGMGNRGVAAVNRPPDP